MLWHKELGKDEVFLGNTTLPLRSYLSTDVIPSLRLGEQAYDIHGVTIPRDYMRPLICKRGADFDRYNNIMEERLKAIARG
jgi:hypothetical protein